MRDGRIVEVMEVVGAEGSRVLFERFLPLHDTVLKRYRVAGCFNASMPRLSVITQPCSCCLSKTLALVRGIDDGAGGAGEARQRAREGARADGGSSAARVARAAGALHSSVGRLRSSSSAAASVALY